MGAKVASVATIRSRAANTALSAVEIAAAQRPPGDREAYVNVLSTILTAMARVNRASAGALYMLDPSNSVLIRAAAYGGDEPIEEGDSPQTGCGAGHGRDHPPAVAACRHRCVLFETDRGATGDSTLDIEGPEPRSRPVFRARDVQKRSRIERRQEVHGRVLVGQLLGRFTGRPNAPDVHVAEWIRPMHDVDPLAVCRPHRIVRVHAPPDERVPFLVRYDDWAGIPGGTIRDR